MPAIDDSINVVAGILRNAEGCILLAERIADPAMQGLWEFPGGKITDGESAEDALCRELSEELGIVVNRFEHFTSLQHQYSDRHVAIDFYLVHEWVGTPTHPLPLWPPTKSSVGSNSASTLRCTNVDFAFVSLVEVAMDLTMVGTVGFF